MSTDITNVNQIGADAVTPLVWDDANKRVGVAIAAPLDKIDVSGGGVSVGSETEINFSEASVDRIITDFIPGTHTGRISVAGDSSNVAKLNFRTGTPGSCTDRMTIDGYGKIGIGTTSPTGIFQTKKDTGTNSQLGIASSVGPKIATSGASDFTPQEDYPFFELKMSGQLKDGGTVDILNILGLERDFVGKLDISYAVFGYTHVGTAHLEIDVVCDDQIVTLISDALLGVLSVTDEAAHLCVLHSNKSAGDSSKIWLKNNLGATAFISYHFIGCTIPTVDDYAGS